MMDGWMVGERMDGCHHFNSRQLVNLSLEIWMDWKSMDRMFKFTSNLACYDLMDLASCTTFLDRV